MKRFTSIIPLMTALVVVSSCMKNEISSSDFGAREVVASFSLNMDNGLETRTISDGMKVDELVVAVYENGEEITFGGERIVRAWPLNDDEKISFTLFKGHTYQILFWAHVTGKYDIGKDGKVTAVKYDENGGFAAMEEMDAFYTVKEYRIDGPVSESVTLTRPMAQLNFLDRDPEIVPVPGTDVATVELTGAATGFNALTGTYDGSTDMTFRFSDFPGESLTIDGMECEFVASMYLFPAEGVSACYRMNDQESKQVLSIPLAANRRTNVSGSIVKAPVSVWDGETATEPMKDGAGRYVIDNASDLAWLQRENTLEAGTFVLTTDYDFNGHTMAPLHLPAGSTVLSEGDEARTIMNVRMEGGFFGDARGLSLENIIFDRVEAGGTSHVGVLVNTLFGEGSFKNVTVTNSSATTSDGAAGGLVGYIEGSAVIENCRISATSVSGELSEGSFVGLLRGYENNETLAFSDCSFTAPETAAMSSFVSPYREGNEAEWLSENDYSEYDGWLGDEKYYRGASVMTVCGSFQNGTARLLI